MRFIVATALALGSSASLAHAAAFDPVAATDAYLASVQGAARARSDAYFEGGYWLLLWGALIGALVPWLLLRSGIAARLSAWSQRAARGRRWLRALLFALIFPALVMLLSLPWTIYTDFVREHQYAMSRQSFADWFGQWALGAAISTVVFGLLLFALLSVYRRRPQTWWAWGTLISGLFLIVGFLVTPVYIAPLFNRYSPMPAGPLRDRIIVMARANGVPATDVFVVNASRQTERISANVSGLGPTARITINDNLLRRCSPAEVRAVVGHELGHYVLEHSASLVFGYTVLAGGLLLLLHLGTSALLRRYGTAWGISGDADPAVLAPALMMLALLGLLFTPLNNNLVRFQERQADYFGINAARAPDGWARLALKLGEYRKLEPSPLEEAIFFDHPSGRSRILMGMGWKAQHLGETGVE